MQARFCDAIEAINDTPVIYWTLSVSKGGADKINFVRNDWTMLTGSAELVLISDAIKRPSLLERVIFRCADTNAVQGSAVDGEGRGASVVGERLGESLPQ